MNGVRLAPLFWLGLIAVASATTPVDFQRDVRPVFERHCFRCHGAEKQKGGLRLDVKQRALAGGDSGPAIVAGRASESELLRRIASTDRDEMMPPEGARLSTEELARVRGWIDAGAEWPETAADRAAAEGAMHWAWAPLVRPKVPEPKRVAWCRTPVDRFIAVGLEAHGLEPSPEADRRTLVRRLYFDLVGLPPTDAEVEAFVADANPAAYERLVDRLLASPQYGERWARHWLDVVHFGETHGYDKDQPRPNAWPYRDYVIRALNTDKPYARFIEEQVAGDALYPHTPDGVVALGFLAAGPWDLIGHKEVPESKRDGRIARHLDRDDVVGTVIGTFNSLTVQCAQCHAHKFDPIPQEDYYRLQAVFAAVDRADKSFYADPQVDRRYAELVATQREQAGRVTALDADVAKAAGPELAAIDGRLKQVGKTPEILPPEYGYHSQIAAQAVQTKWVQVDLESPQGIADVVLVGCWDDFNRIGAGFGFPPRYRVELSDDPQFVRDVTVIIDRTKEDAPNPGVAPQRFAVGKQGRYVRITATRLAPRMNDYILALAELEVRDAQGKNLAAGKPVTALDTIDARPRWQRQNLVDGLAPKSSVDSGPESPAQLRDRRKALLVERVPEPLRNQLADAKRQLQTTQELIAALPAPQQVFAATIHFGNGAFRGTGPDGGRPRPIHVLQRGDVDQPVGPELGPGGLNLVRALPATFDLPSNHAEQDRRAALAKWIASRENPLTWRSIVNRVWLYHFGRGLVDTPNDFGRMGQPPSHPELLDWLAADFRDGGQSLKQLHRLLVTSSVYRQSSVGRAAAEKNDINNVWLWRMNRRRLEAEALRDGMLKIAGKLDPTMAGPSFQDFAVEHPEHSPHYEYDRKAPDERDTLRRSVYRFLVRSNPQPWMTVLDCADPSMRVEKRNQSLSPLQALAMLNDGFVVSMSQHFAERIAAAGGDLPAQVERACRDALARPPRDAERQALVVFTREHGLANLCRLLFNLNEFTFVD